MCIRDRLSEICFRYQYATIVSNFQLVSQSNYKVGFKSFTTNSVPGTYFSCKSLYDDYWKINSITNYNTYLNCSENETKKNWQPHILIDEVLDLPVTTLVFFRKTKKMFFKYIFVLERESVSDKKLHCLWGCNLLQ